MSWELSSHALTEHNPTCPYFITEERRDQGVYRTHCCKQPRSTQSVLDKIIARLAVNYLMS